MKTDARFLQALSQIDAANALDPNTTCIEDRRVPDELLYGQRMTESLARLYPGASDILQLAARAQHIRRWEIPRSSYPMDRGGYLRWRTRLQQFHAEVAGEILTNVGYEATAVARLQSLLTKQNLKHDAEAQALEDVICLTFLEHYFDTFASDHDDAKLISILRRTWQKMSPVGHEAAQALSPSARLASLLGKALG